MRPADPFGWRELRGWVALAAVLVFFGPRACMNAAQAQAPLRLSPASCEHLTEIVAIAARARDSGVPKDTWLAKVLEVFQDDDLKDQPALQRLVLREVVLVYDSGKPAAELENDAHARCLGAART